MKWIIFFGLVALAHTSTDLDPTKTASNYCKMNVCPKGTKSVACSFVTNATSVCNGEPISFDTSALIKKHNDYRQKLASGGYLPLYLSASRMAQVKYNDELAQMALYNANLCEFAHDSCRATKNFPIAGQNLAVISWYDGIDIDKTVAQFVDMWFNEYKLGNMVQIKNLVDYMTIGHFTQMVQEKNTDIGCALAAIPIKGIKSLYLVCNYGYGNMSPIYTSGPAASKCTKKSSDPKYSSLCSVY